MINFLKVDIKEENRQKLVKIGLSALFPGAGHFYAGNKIAGYSGNGWAFDTDIVPDASQITPKVNKPNERSKNSISLSVNLDVGLDMKKIYSPSHNINVDKKVEGLYSVKLDKDKALPNKDFVL